MNNTTAFAITGIVTSGVVGPGFAALWQRRHHHRQFEHERALDQREDLRALLDDAGLVLGAGVTSLRVGSEWSGPGFADT